MVIQLEMNSLMYEIFYPVEKFDTKEKLDKLKSYMYSNRNGKEVVQERSSREMEPITIVNIVAVERPPTVERVIEESPKPIVELPCKKELYFPDKQNSLFWSLYISLNGMNDYLTLPKGKQRTLELSENQKVMDWIQKNPKAMKTFNHKITQSKTQQILSDLMIISPNNLSVLFAYSAFYETSIVIFHKYTYLEIKPTETTEKTIHIIYDDTKKRYGLKMENEEPITIPNYAETHISLEFFGKPLKSVGNYKVSDLQEMATKANVKCDAKQKKADLYLLLETALFVLTKEWLYNKN